MNESVKHFTRILTYESATSDSLQKNWNHKYHSFSDSIDTYRRDSTHIATLVQLF